MFGTRMRRGVAAITLALAVVMAGCANDQTVAEDATGEPTVSTTPAADAPDETAPPAAPEDAAEWQKVTTTPNCQCSDGSEFFFFIHRGTSSRLLFYMQGGGACFSAETCGPTKPSFTRNLADDADGPTSSGIFDFSNDRNPFGEDTIVYVPYCTGDLHLGNAVHDYGNGVVIHHSGATNAGTALTSASLLFSEVDEVVVAGSSAGSAPTPAYAGLASDLFPDATITSIGDASGAYPGTEAITAGVSALWGIRNSLPRWPETANDPASAWSLPGLFVQATKHAPDVTYANINTAYDDVQQDFVRLAGFPDKDLMEMIDENTAQAEAGGATIASWVGPGELHTILGRPQLYEVEVGGTKLIDWLSDLVAGEDVADVHCTECGKPA